MRLSISNIAWDPSEDESIATLLKKHAINAIDVAPSKYFPAVEAATAADLVRVRGWWADRNIEIVGMQALLFGTSGLNLFGGPDVQDAMLRHLKAICMIGAGLGATRLVFGSPKNRDRRGFDDAGAAECAASFFRRLGDIAQAHGVTICLEPNPPRYGANFMTTAAETASVVTMVAHPAIAMQLDTGGALLAGEDVTAIVDRYSSLIGHIHASEPDLVPLGDGGIRHEAAAAAIKRRLPHHIVTIEMVAPPSETRLGSIDGALKTAVAAYRTGGE